MEDKRNFIEYTQARAEKATGRALSPSELASEFTKVSPAERVDHLVRIDGDLRDANLSLNEAAKFHAFRRALNSTHERLRSIDR
jgi:hypothetical protein